MINKITNPYLQASSCGLAQRRWPQRPSSSLGVGDRQGVRPAGGPCPHLPGASPLGGHPLPGGGPYLPGDRPPADGLWICRITLRAPSGWGRYDSCGELPCPHVWKKILLVSCLEQQNPSTAFLLKISRTSLGQALARGEERRIVIVHLFGALPLSFPCLRIGCLASWQCSLAEVPS